MDPRRAGHVSFILECLTAASLADAHRILDHEPVDLPIYIPADVEEVSEVQVGILEDGQGSPPPPPDEEESEDEPMDFDEEDDEDPHDDSWFEGSEDSGYDTWSEEEEEREPLVPEDPAPSTFGRGFSTKRRREVDPREMVTTKRQRRSAEEPEEEDARPSTSGLRSSAGGTRDDSHMDSAPSTSGLGSSTGGGYWQGPFRFPSWADDSDSD